MTIVISAGAGVSTICLRESQRSIGNRVVLQVDHLEVASNGDGYLEVGSPTLDTAIRIGLFPLSSFDVENGDAPRQFLLPDAAEYCRQVGIVGEGVTARISLQVQDMVNPNE